MDDATQYMIHIANKNYSYNWAIKNSKVCNAVAWFNGDTAKG